MSSGKRDVVGARVDKLDRHRADALACPRAAADTPEFLARLDEIAVPHPALEAPPDPIGIEGRAMPAAANGLDRPKPGRGFEDMRGAMLSLSLIHI